MRGRGFYPDDSEKMYASATNIQGTLALLYVVDYSYTTKVPIVIAGNWHFNYIDRGQVSGRVLTFPYTNFVHSDMKDPRILQKMMTEIGAIIHRCLMLYRK